MGVKKKEIQSDKRAISINKYLHSCYNCEMFCWCGCSQFTLTRMNYLRFLVQCHLCCEQHSYISKRDMKIKLAQFHHTIILQTGLNYWKKWSLEKEGWCLRFLVGLLQWVLSSCLEKAILSNFSITTRFKRLLRKPLIASCPPHPCNLKWVGFTFNCLFFTLFLNF